MFQCSKPILGINIPMYSAQSQSLVVVAGVHLQPTPYSQSKMPSVKKVMTLTKAI